MTEEADTLKPEFYKGVLDFNTGTGVLTLTSTEFLDLALGSDGAAKTGNIFTPADISRCSDGVTGDNNLTRCTGLTGTPIPPPVAQTQPITQISSRAHNQMLSLRPLHARMH